MLTARSNTYRMAKTGVVNLGLGLFSVSQSSIRVNTNVPQAPLRVKQVQVVNVVTGPLPYPQVKRRNIM